MVTWAWHYRMFDQIFTFLRQYCIIERLGGAGSLQPLSQSRCGHHWLWSQSHRRPGSQAPMSRSSSGSDTSLVQCQQSHGKYLQWRKIFIIGSEIWVTADGETTHKWLRICWHCFYLLSIVPVTTECNKIYLLMQCNFILNSTWKGDHGPLQYFWMWKEPAVFGAPTLFSRQSMDGFDSNLVQILMAS